MSKEVSCPKGTHFHVSCQDVYEKEHMNFIFEVASPNDALGSAIKQLPASWEGSIEVNDHSTLKPSSMPLIDFWRTPTA